MSRVVDNFIDREIGKQMLAEVNAKEILHKSSGKLSASKLGDPLQWQILHVLGVEKEALDEYVVRKFERGHQIEAWVLKYFNVISQQEFAQYRGVVGQIDAIVDTTGWDFPHGIIPVEVKSVANAKFKRIVATGPDLGHIYQAVFYGLAKESEWVAVCYVASDDYRVQTYIIKVDEYKGDIDNIITRFDETLKAKKIPMFVAREKWQSNLKYNRYPEYMTMDEKELEGLSIKLFKNEK